MTIRKHLLSTTFLFVLTSIFSLVSAQHHHHIHIKQIENTAYESFRIEEYEEALKNFLVLDSLSPNNSDYNLHTGLSYYYLSEPRLSLKYLLRAREYGHKAMYDLNYFLARDYHLSFFFDSAKVYYEKHLAQLSKEHKTTEINKKIAEINRFIQNCAAGNQIMKDTVPIVIENLGSTINSPAGDYAPNLSADESMLIFTSRRDNGLDEELAPDGKPHEDIYISVKDDKGSWGAPIHMGDSINTPGHDACVGLSADGHKLYIYRSWERRSVSGDIYVSELKGNKWQSLYRFTTGKINSRQYWESSLNFSSDGKWMFFTSDRAGGYGASDIYYSKKTDTGVWSEPKNLGPNINTEYAEDAPVLHSDGKTLFFSSKGHAGMGGFDIFSSNYDEKNDTWSPPRNLGYPINTPDNDLYFSYTADGSKAYFSSKRPGGFGDKDIYVLHRPGGSPSMVVLKGKIKSQGSDDPIPATITVRNTETNAIENVFSTNPETGKYVVVLGFGKTYEVKIESKGHMYKSETITIPEERADVFQHVQDFFIDMVENHPEPEKTDKPVAAVNVRKTSGFLKGTDIEYVQAFYEKKNRDSAAITIYPRTPDPKKSVQHNITYAEAFFDSVSSTVYTMHISLAKLESGKKFVLYDIFFDFNKYNLQEASLPELESLGKILTDNPQLKLEISGHTDNKGKDSYNMILSQNRAKSVVNYLVEKGISKSRLIALGYGETIPVADNNSKYGRHLNRRIEFQILDTLKQSSNSEADIDYLKLLPMKVHFEKNVSKKITKFSKERLDELVHFIDHNQDLKIGIVANQDSTMENNSELVSERANTAKNYLISHGVSEDNLMIIAPDKIKREITQLPAEMRKVEFYILN